MKQQISPAIVAVVIILVIAVLGGLYYTTLGKGAKASREEEKWSKPLKLDPIPAGKSLTPEIPPPPTR